MNPRKNSAKENQLPLTLQQKMTTEMSNFFPKVIAEMIAEYSHPSYKYFLKDSDIVEAKQTASKLESHATGNREFYKKSLYRFLFAPYPYYICNKKLPFGVGDLTDGLLALYAPISCVIGLLSSPFVATLQTAIRKHPYHWQEIAGQLKLLGTLEDDQMNQFIDTCIKEYISIKNRPSNNTLFTLLKLQGKTYAEGMYLPFQLQELRSEYLIVKFTTKDRLLIIEQFLADPTNSHSSLYKILIKNLEVLSVKLWESKNSAGPIKDSKHEEKITQASQGLFQPAPSTELPQVHTEQVSKFNDKNLKDEKSVLVSQPKVG